MRRLIMIAAVTALAAPGLATAGLCSGLSEEKCHDLKESMAAAREARLAEYDPNITWQRAPVGKKFTYRVETEGLDAAAEREMIRREDERNGFE